MELFVLLKLDLHTVLCRFSLVKLSQRGHYALRALIVLGLNYSDSVVRIQTISAAQNIPKRFLEQILNDLKSAGIVESKRGVAGADRFFKSAPIISLAALVLPQQSTPPSARCLVGYNLPTNILSGAYMCC